MHKQFSHARERPAAGSGRAGSFHGPGRRRARAFGPVIVSLLIILQLFVPAVIAGPAALSESDAPPLVDFTASLSTEPTIEAGFTANVTSGYPPLAVQFTDCSSGVPVICRNWSFGDGSWFNTTDRREKNPLHVYARPGSYDVRLLVTGPSEYEIIEPAIYPPVPGDEVVLVRRPLISDWENKSGYISVGLPEVLAITSPTDDTVVNETLNITGTVSDASIDCVTLTLNGRDIGTAAVEDGNFTAPVLLEEINTVTVSAVDSNGFLQTAKLLLDGDMLPGDYEVSIGFDPLDPDSDNVCTEVDEAGNGTLDGWETLNSDRLPVFVEFYIGADPFLADTDNDSLTDEFELLKLGLMTDVTLADTDGDGIPDADEDADEDGLTNYEEQIHGSDPLIRDTDGDSLDDIAEIPLGTDPAARDSDGDWLDDDSELRLGTSPLVPDSDGDGVPDGREVYTSHALFVNDTIAIDAVGIGDAVRRATVYPQNYSLLIPDDILVSQVYAVTFGNDTESGTLAIHYDTARVTNPSALSVFVKNETSGSFDPIPFTSGGSGCLSASVSLSGEYCVMDRERWDARFDAAAELMMYTRLSAPFATITYTNITEDPKPLLVASSDNITAGTTKQEPVYEAFFVPDPVEDKLYSFSYEPPADLVEGRDYGGICSEEVPA